MRVLHVVPGLASRTGGPGTTVLESALAVRTTGIETAVYSTDLGEPAAARTRTRLARSDLPASVATLDLRLFRASFPRRLAFSAGLARALRTDVARFDVVHVHSLFLFPQFAAVTAASRRGVAYVVSPRGALSPYLRRTGRLQKDLSDALWQRRALARAAALHATSTEEAQRLEALFPQVPCVTVPNGIRWDAFQELPAASSFRERYLGGSRDPFVLSLGRIAPSKGIDVLIDGFARAAATRPRWRLVVAGPDDAGLVPSLQARAQRAGVADRVSFVGMLAGEAKLAALAAADLFATTSHSESFGVAVVEALAAGRASVVSTSVALAADIDAAGAAVVCAPDAPHVAAVLGELLDDERHRAAMGARARDFARRYDWAEVGPALRRLYESVLGGARVTDAPATDRRRDSGVLAR